MNIEELEGTIESLLQQCDELHGELTASEVAVATLKTELELAAKTLVQEIDGFKDDAEEHTKGLSDLAEELSSAAHAAAEAVRTASGAMQSDWQSTTEARTELLKHLDEGSTEIADDHGKLTQAAAASRDVAVSWVVDLSQPFESFEKSQLESFVQAGRERLELIGKEVDAMVLGVAQTQDRLAGAIEAGVKTEADRAVTALKEQIERLLTQGVIDAIEAMARDVENVVTSNARVALQHLMSEVQRRLDNVAEELLRSGDDNGSKRDAIAPIRSELDAAIQPLMQVLEQVKDLNSMVGHPLPL